jgi:RES domain-containing protein
MRLLWPQNTFPISSANSCLDGTIGSTVSYYFNEPTQAGVPSDDGAFAFDPTDTRDVLMSISLDCHDKLFEDISDSFINDGWVEAAGGHWASSHPHDGLIDAWQAFVRFVKHEVRYFFLNSAPNEVADDHEPGSCHPQTLLSTIGSFAREFGLLKTLPTGTSLFRVRERGQKDNWELNAKELGGPPPELANAGRMNPAGISYLYLAFDEKTALGEVLSGPPSTAAIGSFETVQDLIVLDLSDLPPLPSIFDDGQRWEREQLLFLQQFTKTISKPVRKDGREHVEYVPSQVVSEYFSRVFLSDDGQPINGLIYPSAVCPGGKNVVIFPSREGFKPRFSAVSFINGQNVGLADWAEFSAAITR